MQSNFKTMLHHRLKELRGNKTQAEIAHELNVNQQTYARWELGDRQPKLQDLSSLALHFGVTVDRLLGLSDGADDAPRVICESPRAAQAAAPPGKARPCAECKKKATEIDRLNRIVENLSAALAKK